MSHTAPPEWAHHVDACRSIWERSYPNVAWNEVHTGYRYGWEQAHHPQFHGQDWSMVEAELRAGWLEWEYQNCIGTMAHHLQLDWDSVRQCVQLGWEQARRAMAFADM